MEKKIQEFRDGIFDLRTRRFGSVAELMMKRLYGFGKSKNQFHDLFDENFSKRIEVKFATAKKANKATIKANNLIDQCIKSNLTNRTLSSSDIYNFPFDCNIQQVKRKEFDVLYYGLFFSDRIAIFSMTSDEVLSCVGYSDFQHKGNKGEGQFHLNNSSIDYHFQNHFIRWFSYEEFYMLFS